MPPLVRTTARSPVNSDIGVVPFVIMRDNDRIGVVDLRTTVGK